MSLTCPTTCWSICSAAVIATPRSCPIWRGQQFGRRGAGLATGAGDLRLCASADFIRLPPRALRPHGVRGARRARRRLPRLRPSRGHAVPLHEYPGPLLHRLSRRYRRPRRSRADGFQRLVRSLSGWTLVHVRCAPQSSPDRPDRHGARAGCRRRRDFHDVRRRSIDEIFAVITEEVVSAPGQVSQAA